MGKIIEFRGKKVHLGGRLPTQHVGNRRLFAEMAYKLPDEPTATSWLESLLALDGEPGAEGNDQVGLCPYAADAYLFMLRAASLGTKLLITAEQTEAVYAAATGWNGVIGDPSDQGDTVDHMVQFIQTTGFEGLTFGATAMIRPGNAKQIRQANAFLVGGPNLGLSLPDEWLANENSSVWDVAGEPNPANGHDVMGLDYQPDGLIVNSWGERFLVTWAAIAKYADDVRAIDTSNGYGVSGVNAAGMSKSQVQIDLHCFK